jgi:hypothetical protein
MAAAAGPSSGMYAPHAPTFTAKIHDKKVPINSAQIAHRKSDKMRKFLWCGACNMLHQSPIAENGFSKCAGRHEQGCMRP